MDLTPLPQSKAVRAVGYDAGSGTLEVRFRHGGLYDYLDVPPHIYPAMLDSAHPWTEWGEHIKSTYDYRRLE